MLEYSLLYLTAALGLVAILLLADSWRSGWRRQAEELARTNTYLSESLQHLLAELNRLNLVQKVIADETSALHKKVDGIQPTRCNAMPITPPATSAIRKPLTQDGPWARAANKEG